MVSRGVLLLSVVYFCGSNAYILRDYGVPYSPFGRVAMSTQMQEKEYGKESRLYDQNNGMKYMVSSTKLSWNEAQDECKAKGMMLASPTTQTEKDDLETYLYVHGLVPVDAYTGYWIGGHRLSGNDPWIWESNGQDVTGFGWLTGEPNGYEGEDCMELKHSFFAMGWNNYYCSELRGYICEMLPHPVESDKNMVQEIKENTLHEELMKLDKYVGQEETKADSKHEELENNPEISEELTTYVTTTEKTESKALSFAYLQEPIFETGVSSGVSAPGPIYITHGLDAHSQNQPEDSSEQTTKRTESKVLGFEDFQPPLVDEPLLAVEPVRMQEVSPAFIFKYNPINSDEQYYEDPMYNYDDSDYNNDDYQNYDYMGIR